MLYKGYRNTYDFTKFKIIRAFGDVIRNLIIATNTANDEQKQLAKSFKEFKTNKTIKSLHENKIRNNR